MRKQGNITFVSGVLIVVFLAIYACKDSKLGVAGTDKATIPENGQESADVVIVGAGISGLSAAIEAAEKGRSVLVLDVASVFGGHLEIRCLECMYQPGLACIW